MLVPQLRRPRSQFNAEQSNQIAMSPLPPDSVSLSDYEGPQEKAWISFCQKSQHPWRMLVPQLTRPQSQFNGYQSTDTIVNCSLGWMSNGEPHSKGVPSRHTVPFHTLTETIVDGSCFNKALTCSTCNQEDEGQSSGHSFIVRIRKTAPEGLKFTDSKR